MEQENQINFEKKLAMRVSTVTVVQNIILSLFKLLAGIIGNSQAMIADAVHSASDVFSTFVVMIGFHFSAKESDVEHPYGHERLECVASIILAAILFAVGVGIGINGIEKITGKGYPELHTPKIIALVASVISIIVKEWMYRYTRAAAKKINSSALMADAWHHRSDAFSSIGSFAGIIGSKIGFPILDPVAGVVICIFICKAAVDIFKDALSKMTDTACDKQMEEKMRMLALEQDGVINIDNFKTRLFGSKIYVDVEIVADGDKSLNETHEIAQKVHDAIENEFKQVKHCMVHVNPCRKEGRDE
ncbi:MAG: cation diffusion facilitator family transporter [Clostridia bacterium]|nr:cation diffusion facilitator family transporter [Clostridia bacterium]